MKSIRAAAAAVASALLASEAVAVQAESPVAKVLSMISDLQAKVISEGEVAQKEYEEFAEWCEERGANLGHEIKTGKSQAESLKSASAKEASTVAALTAKLEELTAALNIDQSDLKAATEI